MPRVDLEAELFAKDCEINWAHDVINELKSQITDIERERLRTAGQLEDARWDRNLALAGLAVAAILLWWRW